MGPRALRQMDLVGQRTAERAYLAILLGAALPAFLCGWLVGSLKLMLMIYAASTVVAVLAAVPDWPFYNRHPLRWLPKGSGSRQVQAAASAPALPSSSSQQRRAFGKRR